MSNEKMREEFEAWASKEGYVMRSDGADYYCHETSEAYAAWKASRAALCVELPHERNGSLEMRERCKDAIESTGVRTR